MKLIVKNVKKSFDKKDVLNGLNYEFEQGKIYGLLGRNGAGKTTFFNLVDEDLDLDYGEILCTDNNGDTRTLEPEDVGYVLSTPAVPSFLTAREFIKFFLDINNDRIENKKSIDEYFDMVGIEVEDRDRLLRDFSHGMKSKMQMLVNVISSSSILLLDEPLTALDVVAAEEMKDMLRKIKDKHIIILSTHILDLAVTMCDEIVILNNGVLEKIEISNLNDDEIKSRVIDALKDENKEA